MKKYLTKQDLDKYVANKCAKAFVCILALIVLGLIIYDVKHEIALAYKNGRLDGCFKARNYVTAHKGNYFYCYKESGDGVGL